MGVTRALPLLIILAPALTPVLRPGLWLGHDTFPHLFRLVDLDIVLRGRVLYTRWLPDLGFFYGFPTLNFYAPLTYYLTLLVHWFGAGFLMATKVSYALSFLVAALGMYVWMRDFWPYWPALVAAAVYTYVPYHLANAYVRGTISEHWAQALAPWLFWQMGRVARGKEGGARLALLVAALILTHNLSAFLLIPAALIYAALVGDRHGVLSWAGHASSGLYRARNIVLAGAVGILVTAFYWLPALREISLVRAGQLPLLSDEHIRQLAGVRDLISPFFLYRYYPHQGTALQHPLAWWQVALFLLGLILAWRRWPWLTSDRRGLLVAATVLPLLAGFLMSRASLFFWQNLRPLALVQFPWRLQTILALMSAVWAAFLTADGARWAMDRRRTIVYHLLSVVLIALIAVVGLARLPVLPLTWAGNPPAPVREVDLSPAGFARYEFANGLRAREHGDPWIMPFLPQTVRLPRETFWLPRAADEPTPPPENYVPPTRVTLERVCPTDVTLTVVAPADTFIRWHQFWFPGWRARVDRVEVATRPSPSLGLVTVPIPAGRHRVRLWFGGTPFRRVTAGIALLGVAVLVAMLWREGRRQLLLALVLALLFWLGMWGWQNARRSTCVRPQTTWLTVGEERRAVLLGLADLRGTAPADTVITVAAYWLALNPISEDWKAFLHVVDGNGRPLGQHDAFPGENFSPTSRWEVGEIVFDPHTVVLARSRPPGLHFRVGMYLFDGGIRNQVLRTPEGREIGSYWEVGTMDGGQ